MERVGLLVLLEAKPNRVQEVEEFLKSAQPLAQAEEKTIRWYALRLDSVRFAIFDTFGDESGRSEHVAGQIAIELFARAESLFAKAPEVNFADVLAAK